MRHSENASSCGAFISVPIFSKLCIMILSQNRIRAMLRKPFPRYLCVTRLPIMVTCSADASEKRPFVWADDKNYRPAAYPRKGAQRAVKGGKADGMATVYTMFDPNAFNPNHAVESAPDVPMLGWRGCSTETQAHPEGASRLWANRPCHR